MDQVDPGSDLNRLTRASLKKRGEPDEAKVRSLLFVLPREQWRYSGGNEMREVLKMVRPQIVLFGDSIVEDSVGPGGWGASLAHTFSRKADVVVRGYDGYNTRWASLFLNQLFPLNGPIALCAALIFFGADDSALLGSSSQRQHVPQDQYKDNLRKIVTHLKELSPAMVVVLVTPLPVDEFGREQHARSLYGDKKNKLPDQTNEMTGSYARQCLEVAQEMQLPWIDLWFTMQQISDWKKLFFCSDGSQLTKEGNALVHREVVQVLIESGINAQDMQTDCPHHFEIEEPHPEHAFQQDIYSSHPVDMDYEDDFVAEMVIPSCIEDSKLMSTPLQMAPTFEFDPLLVPLPDDAFFPSSSCATSSGGHSTSYMADPTPGFTDREENRCQKTGSIQIKEEPLSFVVPDSSMLLLTRIKEEHSGPTTPPKEDERIGLASASKKVGKATKKKRSKRKLGWLPKKSKTTGKKGSITTAKMCMHCQTTKTPQWRAGPEGAKTLCNACGVRYRLGRLYPEYRPIHSPTFVPELHSNSHREVAKIRRLKEGQVDWVEC